MDILSVFAQRSRGARLIAAGRTTTIASIHDLRQLRRLSVDLDMLFNFYRWHWEQFEECREWDIRRREQRLPGLNQTLSRVTVLAGIAASLTYRTYLQGLQRPHLQAPLGLRPRPMPRHRTPEDHGRFGTRVYEAEMAFPRTPFWPDDEREEQSEQAQEDRVA